MRDINELIEEAKKKYPIGSKLKNHLCDSVFEFRHKFRQDIYDNGLVCESSSGDYTIYDSLERWAEIIEYPSNYKPVPENLIEQLQLV